MRKFLQSVIQSTAFGIIVLPVTLYYTVRTWLVYRIEAQALRDAIDESDDFWMFLEKMRFVAAKYGTALVAKHEYNKELTEAETYEIARTNMQKFVIAFFESEELLGLCNMSISIDAKKKFVTTILKPAHYDIHLRNLLELGISALIWSVAAVSLYLYL